MGSVWITLVDTAIFTTQLNLQSSHTIINTQEIHKYKNIRTYWANINIKKCVCWNMFVCTGWFCKAPTGALYATLYPYWYLSFQSQLKLWWLGKRGKFGQIQGVFYTGSPHHSSNYRKVNLDRLGVSRTIYVNVDSPYLYFNFLGEAQCKKNTMYNRLGLQQEKTHCSMNLHYMTMFLPMPTWPVEHGL